MELTNKKCYYCSHPEHVIFPISINNADLRTLQGRLCEKSGHWGGLFSGGSHSAYTPREIDPVDLPKIIQQIRHKHPQTQPIT